MKKPKTRNNIARACRLVHKPKIVKSKRGKGSYDRKKKGGLEAPYFLCNFRLFNLLTKEVRCITIKPTTLIQMMG